MTWTLLGVGTRKPGMSLEDFRSHYETVHVPLIKDLVGEIFPIYHTRNYVQRNDQGKPIVFQGRQDLVNFDVSVEAVFSDLEHFRRFSDKLAEPEKQAKLMEDAAKFFDLSTFTTFPIGEACVTKP